MQITSAFFLVSIFLCAFQVQANSVWLEDNSERIGGHGVQVVGKSSVIQIELGHAVESKASAVV